MFTSSVHVQPTTCYPSFSFRQGISIYFCIILKIPSFYFCGFLFSFLQFWVCVFLFKDIFKSACGIPLLFDEMMLPQLQIDFSIFIIYLYYGLESHLLFTVLYLSFGISGFFNSQKLFYFSRCVPMDFFKSNSMILFSRFIFLVVKSLFCQVLNGGF